MNFWEIIILFFSFQAFVFSLLFFFRRGGDKMANSLLAVLLLLFSYNMFYNVLFWSRFSLDLYTFLTLTYAIPLSLYGPLFYLYIRRITTGKSLKLIHALHALPFLYIIYQFGSFYLLPLRTKKHVMQNGLLGDYTNIIPYTYILIVAILFSYGLLTLIKFSRYYRSDPEMAAWLKTITVTFFLFTLSHVFYCTMSKLNLIEVEQDYIVSIFMALLISSVGYFAFVHASIFNGTPIKKIIPFVKYEKTGLSTEFSLEMKEKLEVLMAEKKPYLNPDLRLDHLANMLDVSRHHASQIINEHFSVNFFDFVNRFRIKEAERLLSSDDERLSISDIAFQSGFNNRISFYKAFKKVLNTTPSDYREHNMAS